MKADFALRNIWVLILSMPIDFLTNTKHRETQAASRRSLDDEVRSRSYWWQTDVVSPLRRIFAMASRRSLDDEIRSRSYWWQTDVVSPLRRIFM